MHPFIRSSWQSSREAARACQESMIHLALPIQSYCHADFPQRISGSPPKPQKQLPEDLEGLKAHSEAVCCLSHFTPSNSVWRFNHPSKSWSSPQHGVGIWHLRCTQTKHGACRRIKQKDLVPHGAICNPNSRDRQRKKHHLCFMDVQLQHN